MRRRDFVVAGAATFVLPAVAGAQKKTLVIGLLWNDSVKPSPYATVLLNALRAKGWVLGRDYVVDDRVSLEGYGGYAENAAALVRANVDLIVAYGSTSVVAVAKATKEIPIVMNIGVDPVANGLVASLARPGGNLTGVMTAATRVNAKRIELLKDLVPGLASFGVVLAPNVANPQYVRDSEATAQALNLRVHFGQVRAVSDLEDVISGLANARVGALYISPSTMFHAHSSKITEIVAKYRLPAVYASERYPDVGGLMHYGISASKAFVRVADYVDRILKGARPGELPIEQMSDMQLTINLKTAKSLGIKVPQSLLARADRVIE